MKIACVAKLDLVKCDWSKKMQPTCDSKFLMLTW
jgi:hypothetical protein